MNDSKNIRDQIFGMTGGSRAVLEQLFLSGPTADGDIVDKQGRGELVRSGHAFHRRGYASLTESGMDFAIEILMLDREKDRRDNERRRRSA